MAMNPLLKKLVEQYAAKYGATPVVGLTPWREGSSIVPYVRSEMDSRRRRLREERNHWFNSYALPRLSVLVRLPSETRSELIDHFREKEVRVIVKALNENDAHIAGCAIKRLKRVNKLSVAFAEIDAEEKAA